MRTEEVGTALVETSDETAGSLVRLALERGVDVSVLERIVALQERVTERNARAAFIEALAAFQQECPPILKTRENTQFSVTRSGVKRSALYAPLEEIQRVARPVAGRLGLVWTWDTKVDDTLMHVTCRVLHALGHSESATVSLPFESKAGSSPQQKFGSTQTYGMRYSLVAALGITTADEDLDGAGLVDPEPISEFQVRELEDKIKATGSDRARFLAFLGVDDPAQITVDDYPKAIWTLDRRSAKASA